MGRKLGLTHEDVIDAAAAIADSEGLPAASLSAVADRLGIQTPSLYNHVAGLKGLRRDLAFRAAARSDEALAEAIEGLQGAEALRAAAHAYRAFARNHPGLYASMLPAPRPGEDDELYELLAGTVARLASAVVEAGVAPEDTIDTSRGLRAMLHGFADLEARGGFGLPVDIDASFDRAVDLFVDGLATTAG